MALKTNVIHPDSYNNIWVENLGSFKNAPKP